LFGLPYELTVNELSITESPLSKALNPGFISSKILDGFVCPKFIFDPSSVELGTRFAASIAAIELPAALVIAEFDSPEVQPKTFE
jgi:hypothetical protein